MTTGASIAVAILSAAAGVLASRSFDSIRRKRLDAQARLETARQTIGKYSEFAAWENRLTEREARLEQYEKENA